jgi:flavodoxin
VAVFCRRESDDLRKQADYKFDMYKLMMRAYGQANEIGNTAKAQELKEKAAALKAEGENLVSRANIAAFESHNKSITNKWKVDLHGMGLQPAMQRFDQQFKTLKAMNNPGGVLMEVITGKGKHSDGGVARIKNTVLSYLADANVPHGVDPKNDGVVWVALPGSATTDADGSA